MSLFNNLINFATNLIENDTNAYIITIQENRNTC